MIVFVACAGLFQFVGVVGVWAVYGHFALHLIEKYMGESRIGKSNQGL